jgi:hypothetical protein
MNLRRIVYWIVVIGLLAWIVSNPSRAGHTASHMVNVMVGWGESFVAAVVAFFTSLG